MNNQEAIKAMHNLNMVLSITPSEREAVNMAIAALEEQQSRREWYQKGYADGKKDAENDRWIPVEERLPEEVDERQDILILLSSGRMVVANYVKTANKGKIFFDGYDMFHPVAWQPLPEPYKPEKGEK
ncbi:DUF551 domain-containing protein [Lachnospiraceae bacterium LCP19S3_B12]